MLNSVPVGRFAPSPTGDLHFGSLVAALGSYLSCRHRGGRWLIRVEDIDPPREVAGSAERMLAELRHLGLESTAPVLYQGQRLSAHHEAIAKLLGRGLAFACACTRAELAAGGVYVGRCRDGIPAGRAPRSVRVRVDEQPVQFCDRVRGPQSERLDLGCGDFVIRRADGLPAYQLAVVVDDAHQGITEVVRGADLLSSTPRQVHLQRLLGLPTPEYLHLPLALDAQGRKLSKRLGSDPLNLADPAGTLRSALHFLGQDPPVLNNAKQLLAWAVQNWRAAAVPAGPTPPSAPPPDDAADPEAQALYSHPGNRQGQT